MIWVKTVRKIVYFFKNRFNSCQKALTTLGCIIGVPLSIILIITGVAAIPFTGASSLLPSSLALLLFLVIVTGSFASAGKYIGLSLDTILNKEQLTNEKIATIAGCCIGLTLSIVAIPLHFVGVRFILEKAAIAMWALFTYFVPLTIGAFGSACSYIGRSIDTITNQKTIFDFFEKQESRPPQEKQIIESHAFVNKKLIKKAAFPPRLKAISNKKNSHLHFFFKRHATYKKLSVTIPNYTISVIGQQNIIMIGKQNDSYSIRP
ncbi:MAG: hypothetical protein A3F42_00445 [Gammaproteobacteria bacterium RIFCSPHIGHO2_12_FULL_37_34]|nr:MAG: hypothetical protein A3F42_00445 [Gammaproteobacteria bacterium RIFCSPHIGHO2_12_FULL_37_34]